MDRNAGVSGLAAPRAAPSPLVKGLAAEKENTPVKPPNPGRRSSIGGKTPGRTPTSVGTARGCPDRGVVTQRRSVRALLVRRPAGLPGTAVQFSVFRPVLQILRKRPALAPLSAEGKKKRKSLGRRVSFAPDPEARAKACTFARLRPLLARELTAHKAQAYALTRSCTRFTFTKRTAAAPRFPAPWLSRRKRSGALAKSTWMPCPGMRARWRSLVSSTVGCRPSPRRVLAPCPSSTPQPSHSQGGRPPLAGGASC